MMARDKIVVRARETDATAERVGKRDNLDKAGKSTDGRAVKK